MAVLSDQQRWKLSGLYSVDVLPLLLPDGTRSFLQPSNLQMLAENQPLKGRMNPGIGADLSCHFCE